jgi:hypothetical protein
LRVTNDIEVEDVRDSGAEDSESAEGEQR